MALKGVLDWFKRSGAPKPLAHSRIIHQAPTDRPVFAVHERNHHITTSGRRALDRSQFALPPGPEEVRRGIKGRLPIDTRNRGRNALQRASMMHHQGHLNAAQLAAVEREVHAAWPSIKSSPHHSTVKSGAFNENGLTYKRWCAAASCKPSAKMRAAWAAGEDPSDYRAAAQRKTRSHSTVKPNVYEVKIGDAVQFIFEPETGGVVQRIKGADAWVMTPHGERKTYVGGLRPVRKEHVDRVRRSVATRSHSTMKHRCYVITMPPTAEMGSYKTRHCGPKATAREHALWDYNSARRHDGLPPVERLPRGTKIIKDLASPHGGI